MVSTEILSWSQVVVVRLNLATISKTLYLEAKLTVPFKILPITKKKKNK